MPLYTLKDCLVVKLMSLYDVETQVKKALPKLVKAASTPILKETFKKHAAETNEQIKRIEAIFRSLGLSPKRLKVKAIRGITEDTTWVTEQQGTPQGLDATLIASARYVEHYEMAGYTSLIEWAGALDLIEQKEILEHSLEEEQHAELKLSEIAHTMNREAIMNAHDG